MAWDLSVNVRTVFIRGTHQGLEVETHSEAEQKVYFVPKSDLKWTLFPVTRAKSHIEKRIQELATDLMNKEHLSYFSAGKGMVIGKGKVRSYQFLPSRNLDDLDREQRSQDMLNDMVIQVLNEVLKVPVYWEWNSPYELEIDLG